jgi:hypothetical protein
MFTLMHCTSLHQKLAAVLVVTSPLAVSHTMETCTILKLVAASVAEAKLGALFLNVQEAKDLQLIFAGLGHPQPPTPIHIYNTTTVGIVNNTIKQQRSRAMEMRYFWLLDGKMQQYFNFYTTPASKKLGDYPSKHYTANIHQHVRPYYVHMDISLTLLPRAMKPSTRQGCAEILGDPYSKKSPLPSIGDFPCLADSPKLSSYQVLGQSRIQQRHTTCYNHPRIEAHNSRQCLLAVSLVRFLDNPVPEITDTDRIIDATARLTATIADIQDAPLDKMEAIQSLCTLLLGKVTPLPPPAPSILSPLPVLTPMADINKPVIIWNPQEVQPSPPPLKHNTHDISPNHNTPAIVEDDSDDNTSTPIHCTHTPSHHHICLLQNRPLTCNQLQLRTAHMINFIIADELMPTPSLCTHPPSLHHGYTLAAQSIHLETISPSSHSTIHFIGTIISDNTGNVLEYQHLMKMDKYKHV